MLFALACSTPEPTDTSKEPTDSTTEPACATDEECGDGEICEADACTPGDRNNSLDEAQAMVWDETVSGALEAEGDVDWYSFTAEGGEWIRARTILPDDADDEDDTKLTLRDAAGKVVAQADDYPTGGSVSSADAVIYAYLADAGTYSLAVEDYNHSIGEDGNFDVDYEYSVTVEEWSWSTDEPDGLELSPSSAYSYTAVGVLIDEAGDSDTITLDLDWGDAGFLVAGALDLGNSESTPVVELQQDGQTLSRFENLGPGGWMIHPELDEATYELVVSDQSGGGGPEHWFFVFLYSEDSGDAWPEEAEPNDLDADATAVPFESGSTGDGDPYVFGHFWGDGDEGSDTDWYFVDRPDYDEAHLVLCATAETHGASSSPVMEVYADDGTLLATSADDATSLDVNIGSTTIESDVYVKVSGGDDAAAWYQAIVYVASFTINDYEDGGYSCP